MNLIKAKFIRDGQPKGMAYTYKTSLDIPIGLHIYVDVRGSHREVVITDTLEKGTAEYNEELSKLESSGYGLDKLNTVDGNDLVVTLVKLEKL